MNLQLPLSFCSCAKTVTETVFISEQITKYKVYSTDLTFLKIPYTCYFEKHSVKVVLLERS